MKPMFKWSGGKRRELKDIKKWIPKEYNIFCEPFVGGGALWLDIAHDNCIVNDSYEDLINFYNVCKEDPKRLADKINEISQNYNKEVEGLKAKSKHDYKDVAKRYFYDIRDSEPTDSFEKAIRFYTLRQLSYGGMLRFNLSGKYNVPYGYYKKFKAFDTDMKELKKVLNNTEILCCDWKDAVKKCGPDDFVFIDPPYTREFTKYHPNGEFLDKEQKELAKWFKATDTRALIIINKDDFTSELYDGYIKEEYGHNYGVRYRKQEIEPDVEYILVCEEETSESLQNEKAKEALILVKSLQKLGINGVKFEKLSKEKRESHSYSATHIICTNYEMEEK